MNRYFRSTDAVLNAIRQQLDDAWGYPDETSKTTTVLPPPEKCRHDALGKVYLFVAADMCEWPPVNELLPPLLASGQVEELTKEQYQQVFPPPQPRPRPS